LPSYLQSISCLQEAYGIKSGADFTNLNKELLLYFKSPSSYKL